MGMGPILEQLQEQQLQRQSQCKMANMKTDFGTRITACAAVSGLLPGTLPSSGPWSIGLRAGTGNIENWIEANSLSF